MNYHRPSILISALVFIIASGSVFFRYVEGWGWVDSYFFMVVTLSTVGYGHPIPVTALGKIGTTVFIFLGLGVFALAIREIGNLTMRRRIERIKQHKRDIATQDDDSK